MCMSENVEPTASDRGRLRNGGRRGGALSPRIDGGRVAVSYIPYIYLLRRRTVIGSGAVCLVCRLSVTAPVR